MCEKATTQSDPSPSNDASNQLISELERLQNENVEQREKVDQLTNENVEQKEKVDQLTNENLKSQELIQELKDEIANLKKTSRRPIISAGRLEIKKEAWRKRFHLIENKRHFPFFTWIEHVDYRKKPTLSFRFEKISNIDSTLQAISTNVSRLAKRMIRTASKPGQPRGKLRKKKKLDFHETMILEPENIPEGAVFKGYRSFAVQDIIFQIHNTLYKKARYMLPDGSYIEGELPKGLHGHYGPELVSYILYQYHACRVPENLLLEQLRSLGTLISAGQIDGILNANKNAYHEEVSELLSAGIAANKNVRVDDTGGRHKGQNQYTTVINNDWFSIFTTTDRKSRINFLKLLQGGKDEYLINEDTIIYLKETNASSYLSGYINFSNGKEFNTSSDWKAFLEKSNISSENDMRFVTESALYASVIRHGIPRDLGVHADDAGQFNVFMRSLCWIHEERHYRKLIMTTESFVSDLPLFLKV